MIDEGAVGRVRSAKLGDDIDQSGYRDEPQERYDRYDFCADFQMFQHGVTRLAGRVASPVLLKSFVAERFFGIALVGIP